jgi:hypothetical protein
VYRKEGENGNRDYKQGPYKAQAYKGEKEDIGYNPRASKRIRKSK